MAELRNNIGLNEEHDISIAELFQKAEAGDADTQCQLGICYYNGENGIEKDLEKAIYWLRKAAWRGNADAQNRLGVRYDWGEGVEKNQLILLGQD